MNLLKIFIITGLLTTLSMAKKEALIVGIADYRGENDLSGIEIDVLNMKTLLGNWGFNVKVLMDSESMGLEQALDSYSYLSKDDSFVFYYSGHGYHVKDKNGDETDGEDEALVLSDGNRNELFLDDALDGYLNQIQAKKLVLLDSCHSGTAFKAFGDKKTMPKSLSANAVDGMVRTKAFRRQESTLSGGEYIVFSASQDKEESQATADGSLFTNALIKEFNSGGVLKELMNIRQSVEKEIYSYCENSSFRPKPKPHRPNLSASSDALKYTTINEFFKTKSTPEPQTEKTISIMGKKTFNEGELLSFKIDTHGNSGYLTIFSMENGEPFIMTQTQTTVKGIFNFQQDFNINPPIECYKSCGTCAKEVSSVYVILSAQPLNKNIMKTKGLKIDRDSHVGMRAFRERTNEAYEPIIASVEFTIY